MLHEMLTTAGPAPTLSVLIADQSRWKDLGSGFRGEQAELDSTDITVGLILIVGSILFFWALSRVMAMQDRRRVYNSPPKLFRSLCAAHELSRQESRLLAQLARRNNLSQPAQLFLDPQRFSGESLRGFSAAQRKQLEALKQRLFAV